MSGFVGIVVGLGSGIPILDWAGLIAVVRGAVVYAADVADVLREATVSYRPPQAFLAAGTALIVGLALSLSASRPTISLLGYTA